MTFVEFIGVIVSLLALIYVSGRQAREERRRARHPEEYEEEAQRERQAYRELLEKLELPIPPELEEEPSPPQKPVSPVVPPRPKPKVMTQRTVRHGFELHTNIEDRHHTTHVEQRQMQTRVQARDHRRFKKAVASESMRVDTTGGAYQLGMHESPSKAQQLIKGLEQPGNMLLVHEIFGKPKGLGPSGPLQGLPWDG